jgi:hypothetical protein
MAILGIVSAGRCDREDGFVGAVMVVEDSGVVVDAAVAEAAAASEVEYSVDVVEAAAASEVEYSVDVVEAANSDNV